MLSHHVTQKSGRQHPLWLEIVRIGLALVMLWKGIEFIENIHTFTEIMTNSSLPVALLLSIVVHLIIVGHLFGAIALFTGSYVKAACILQLPVIVMALVFRNLAEDVLNPYQAVWVSIVILAALLLVLFRDRHDTLNKENPE